MGPPGLSQRQKKKMQNSCSTWDRTPTEHWGIGAHRRLPANRRRWAGTGGARVRHRPPATENRRPFFGGEEREKGSGVPRAPHKRKEGPDRGRVWLGLKGVWGAG